MTTAYSSPRCPSLMSLFTICWLIDSCWFYAHIRHWYVLLFTVCFCRIKMIWDSKQQQCFVFFLPADVWKLDLWNAGLYSAGLHSYIQGTPYPPKCTLALTHIDMSCLPPVGPRYTLLDLDQPLCNMGLAYLLCGILSTVGRNHLVGFVQLPPFPFRSVMLSCSLWLTGCPDTSCVAQALPQLPKDVLCIHADVVQWPCMAEHSTVDYSQSSARCAEEGHLEVSLAHYHWTYTGKLCPGCVSHERVTPSFCPI